MKFKDTPWMKSCDQSRWHIKKQRHTLPTKVRLVKAMVFPVVIYGCESWTIMKAEHWRIDAFELWCWKRSLLVPWTARGSNHSILKEISPEYLLEGLVLKLKLQYFVKQRIDSLEKTLMLGKIEGMGRRGWQRMRWLNGTIDSMDMNLSKQGSLVCSSLWGHKELDMTEWKAKWFSPWYSVSWSKHACSDMQSTFTPNPKILIHFSVRLNPKSHLNPI